MNEYIRYIYREVIISQAILTCDKMEWLYPTGYKITVLDRFHTSRLRPMIDNNILKAPGSEWYKRSIKKQIMFQSSEIFECTTPMKHW